VTEDIGTALLEAVMANPPEPYVRVLSRQAEAAPERTAVTCGTESITRGELERQANRLARAYASLGVGFGDFVTIGVPNSVGWFVSTLACWKLGAVPQPTSYRLPVLERQAIVELANSKLVIGADPADHPGRACLPIAYQPDPALSDAPHDELVSPALKAPTSGGSTGRPKLIVSGSEAVGSGAILTALFGMLESDVQLVPGPLYHNAPLTMAFGGLLLGQHIVVLPKFDAETALDAITRNKVTWLQVVPTMMLRMTRALEAEPSRYDLSSIRALWHMASMCPHWLKDRWIELLGPDRVVELYGGTEMQAMTIITGTEWLEHRGSVGRPTLGEMVVLNDAGEHAGVDEVGEIFMRAGEGMPATYRYIGAEAYSKDGWESLGDLGWMDADGYLYISDRRTDMIVVGGSNIYPAEIEAALDSHPDVLSSVVVGIPDPELGATLHAIVQADGLTADALLAHLSERLVVNKLPRSIEFVDTPLRDDAGKARRSSLRDEAVARLSVRQAAEGSK
jgi:bile acid-coenzyme A ligase